MRSHLRTSRAARRPGGITLLELLIVMVIMLMVTAAAIPMMAPALRNRQMREATRLVSAYLGAARARAVQTGRPVGVMVERFNGGAFALQMSQVEVPPPYSGDTTDSRMKVKGGTLTTSMSAQTYFNNRFGTLGFTAKWLQTIDATGDFNNRLVKIGDQIQFNNQGVHFVVCGPDTNSDGIVDSGSLDVAYPYLGTLKLVFPWDNMTVGAGLPVPQNANYRVIRQPVRTTTQPLTLPDGIVFDLSVSGVGTERYNIQDYASVNIGNNAPPPLVTADPVMIFSPSGRLDYVTNRFGQLVRPLASVNLLMGRRELMFDVTSKTNFKDIVFQNLSAIATPNGGTLMPPAENFWMTIGYQTGQVSVSQVAPNYQNYDATSIGGITPPTNLQGVIDFTLNGNGTAAYPGALGFARESQSLGGR